MNVEFNKLRIRTHASCKTLDVKDIFTTREKFSSESTLEFLRRESDDEGGSRRRD